LRAFAWCSTFTALKELFLIVL